jgi:FMN reductase
MATGAARLKEEGMMKDIKVVGLGGSLAAPSSSLAALKLALAGAAEGGAVTELFDLRELELPMYAPGREAPDSVRKLCEAVYEAGGLLWSIPLYHGTISGVFKNAIDWLELLGRRQPAYLTDKVVGLISTAGGMQGLQAVNTMEFVVRALRGWSVPLVIPIAQAWRVFDDEGHALDQQIAEQLRSLGREVTRAARQFKASVLTTPDAGRAESQVQHVGAEEVASSYISGLN